ncbi:MAG: S8 family peptidase [Bacteroidales bacterium]|nr:S8 family peptidase [Bacteroidales bacterium]
MKKIPTLIAVILFIPFLLSQKPPRNSDKPYVDGEIMIKLRSHLPQSQQQMLQVVLADFQSFDLGMVQRLSDRLNIFLLEFNPSLVDDERLLEDIKAHPFVELAQFNHFVELRALMPDDDFFGLQWSMHNDGLTGGTLDADIDGPEAWELGTSGVTATGDSIIIAIVDDGFDLEHADLRFWKNYDEIPGNGVDDDDNGYIDDFDGWNSWNNSGELVEKVHGTHVSGIAAARGNNGLGVSGVNWNMKVLPVVGSATVEAPVVAAYGYLYEMRSLYNETGGAKGAFIVSNNCSFGVNMGNPEDFPIWGAMYDSLGMVGVLSAGATANGNWNVDEVGDIPSSFTSEFLITVTNTDKNDLKSSSAAYGATTIDLGAPGTQIYSTFLSNDYGYKTGTSMAAPHVTGAVAYLYSVAPEEFMEAYHSDPAGMSLVIKQYLLDGADPVESLQGITVTGGRLNIYESAMLMLNPAVTFDPMSVLMALPPEEKDSVTLTFTNNFASSFNYSFSYPGPLDWMSLSGPVNGTLAPFATGNIRIHFDSEGYTTDTLFTYLTFHFDPDGESLIPVHLFVDPDVGLEETGGTGAGMLQSLEVWPNPCREMLNVECLMLKAGNNYSLAIYNSLGKQVREISIPEGQDVLRINTASFTAGVYFATVKSENQVIGSKKFIVLN